MEFLTFKTMWISNFGYPCCYSVSWNDVPCVNMKIQLFKRSLAPQIPIVRFFCPCFVKQNLSSQYLFDSITWVVMFDDTLEIRKFWLANWSNTPNTNKNPRTSTLVNPSAISIMKKLNATLASRRTEHHLCRILFQTLDSTISNQCVGACVAFLLILRVMIFNDRG